MTSVTSVAAEPRRSAEPGGARLPAWVSSVGGLVGIVVLWQIAGATIFAHGRAVPTPTAIVRQMGKDGWSFYSPNIRTTVTMPFMSEASRGLRVARMRCMS